MRIFGDTRSLDSQKQGIRGFDENWLCRSIQVLILVMAKARRETSEQQKQEQ